MKEKERVDKSEFFDTVGGICLDSSGNVASAVSSGGISLKRNGRVGEAALAGSGCWAANGDSTVASVACSATGQGEEIMKRQLALLCCAELREDGVGGEEALANIFNGDGQARTICRSVLASNGNGQAHSQGKIGIVGLRYVPHESSVEVVYGHSTPSLAFAWSSSASPIPKPIISRNPTNGPLFAVIRAPL
eukprot:TRINITY_DN1277_c0_g1_i1.p1 TRINITY_DN1277_c0_g1~~TRINITY_DN1277_c0_g1_i1.p1  ORF type:complete len:192 (+),score=21.03 TRINITY_DN1277_c0_g1_i1:636-1211(+)